MDGIDTIFSREDMTFQEAVDYFKERVPVTAEIFYQIAEEYRALAFTVSGYTKAQILKKFYDELLRAGGGQHPPGVPGQYERLPGVGRLRRA